MHSYFCDSDSWPVLSLGPWRCGDKGRSRSLVAVPLFDSSRDSMFQFSLCRCTVKAFATQQRRLIYYVAATWKHCTLRQWHRCTLKTFCRCDSDWTNVVSSSNAMLLHSGDIVLLLLSRRCTFTQGIRTLMAFRFRATIADCVPNIFEEECSFRRDISVARQQSDNMNIFKLSLFKSQVSVASRRFCVFCRCTLHSFLHCDCTFAYIFNFLAILPRFQWRRDIVVACGDSSLCRTLFSVAAWCTSKNWLHLRAALSFPVASFCTLKERGFQSALSQRKCGAPSTPHFLNRTLASNSRTLKPLKCFFTDFFQNFMILSSKRPDFLRILWDFLVKWSKKTKEGVKETVCTGRVYKKLKKYFYGGRSKKSFDQNSEKKLFFMEIPFFILFFT